MPSTQKTEFAPCVLLANVISLVPKVNKISILTIQKNFDLIFFTETWLQ